MREHKIHDTTQSRTYVWFPGSVVASLVFSERVFFVTELTLDLRFILNFLVSQLFLTISVFCVTLSSKTVRTVNKEVNHFYR